MLIESPAFVYEQQIPTQYTCDGADLSPPLKFIEVPSVAESLVLIVEDPDAPHGTFDHWIVWNISPQIKNISVGASELSQSNQGVNGFKQIGYNGPCPPPGKPHRYFFKLFALDKLLNVHQGSSKKEVEKAMEGHILEKAELIGTYRR